MSWKEDGTRRQYTIFGINGKAFAGFATYNSAVQRARRVAPEGWWICTTTLL
jgi:hypothetical protein